MGADVTVVGAGPNGLAAGIVLARAGLEVKIIEASATAGGGARTSELIENGFRHDMCSAVHPMGLASPFFDELELTRSVSFVIPEAAYAHATDSDVVLAYRDLARTVDELGVDGRAWGRFFEPLVRRADVVHRAAAGPMTRAGFGAAPLAARVAQRASRLALRSPRVDALLAGVEAHAIGHAGDPAGAAVGVTLATLAHTVGWGIPVGGSSSIIDALVATFEAYGGSIEFNRRVTSVDEISDSEAIVLDVTPRDFARMANAHLSDRALAALTRFRYGPGVAKVDFTLDGPVPWSDPRLARASTVHIGGSGDEIRASERELAAGRMPQKRIVLASEPSRFDATRAPEGKSVLWAYTHVPHGSDVGQSNYITSAIESLAPGFRDLIREKRYTSPRDFEAYNANYVGGDIAAGETSLRQLVFRPRATLTPWRTALPGVYLCSASTPPGPGVHGMCGVLAAEAALRDVFGMDGKQ